MNQIAWRSKLSVHIPVINAAFLIPLVVIELFLPVSFIFSFKVLIILTPYTTNTTDIAMQRQAKMSLYVFETISALSFPDPSSLVQTTLLSLSGTNQKTINSTINNIQITRFVMMINGLVLVKLCPFTYIV